MSTTTQSPAYPSINSSFDAPIAGLAEFLYTFALVLVILTAVRQGERTIRVRESDADAEVVLKEPAGSDLTPLMIGATLAAGAAAIGPITGGVFNPAVGVALPIVNGGELRDVLVYIVGPLLGGAMVPVVNTLLL